MEFFREAEPGIYICVARAIVSEEDGERWTREYDAILSEGRPFAVVADVHLRPQPAAGKPMALWLKAKRSVLASLVQLTVYFVEDDAVRGDLERMAIARMNSLPYPLATAASEAEAVRLARRVLQRWNGIGRFGDSRRQQ